jgi:hypothetical protein
MDLSPMQVRVGVRLPRRIVRTVGMLVMSVVGMTVAVRERLMNMLVGVPLSEVQPDTEPHQTTGGNEGRCNRLPPDQHRQYRTDERSGGEIGAGAGRAETPESKNEQDQTDAIAEDAQQERSGHAEPLRERTRQEKPDRQVDASGYSTLECCDLNRVTAGDLLGEIIVDGPAEAGPGNERRPG